MAENTEKTITIAVQGVEKTVANMEKVDKIAAELRAEFEKTGKVIDGRVNAEIIKMAKQLANVDREVKRVGGSARGLRGEFRNLFKDIASQAGIAGGGISSLFAGIAGGFIGGGVVSLVENATTALFEWITGLSEAEKQQLRWKESLESAIESFAEEGVALDVNNEILQDTTLSYEDREKALENLNEIYPEYYGNLELDKLTNEQLEEAYNNATDALGRKIKQQALSSIATEAYTKVAKLELELAKQGNVELSDSEQNWRLLTGAVFGYVDAAAFASAQQKGLKEEIKSSNAEYEAAKKLLKELEVQQTRTSDATNKSNNGTKKSDEDSKKRLDDIKNSVKDLDEAIKAYKETSINGTEEEIAIYKELVELYRDEAVAANDAAKAATRNAKFNGKSQQELRDELIKTEASFEKLDNALSRAQLDFRELVEQGFTIDAKGNPLVQIFEDGTQLDINRYKDRLNEIFQKVFSRPEGQIVTSEFREAYLQALEEGFVFPVIDSARKAADGARILSRELKAELESIKKQQETTGVASADIINKANEAITEAEENLVKRRVEAQEKLFDLLSTSPELLAQALNKAANTNVREIFEATKRTINEELEATLRGLNDEADVLAEKYNFIGRIVTGDAVSDEDLQIVRENYEKLSIEEQKAVDQIVADINRRRKLAFEANRKDLRKAEIEALDQALKNLTKDNELEIRALKAELQRQKLEYDSYYDDVLESNERFAERMREKNGELSEDDINFIRNQKEQQIKLLQEQLDLELKIETDQALKLLANSELSAEARKTIFQEFLNNQTAIINKYQNDLKKVDADFEKIIDGGKVAKSIEEQFKKIADTIVFYAGYAQQLISNIFALVEQRQQAVIDNLQDNISRIEEQISRANSNIDELEADLEGKRSGRREAILRGIEAEEAREEQLTQKKIELQQRLRAEERKLANQRKAAAISQALINGAIASLNIWANNTIPYPAALAFNIPTQAFVAALTATEVALIAGQKFAKGGYTGSGTQRDETGHKVAGVVHNDEWVAPKWMVESPSYRPIIDQLESARTRGFAEGGFTTPDFGALSSSASPNQMGMIGAMIQRSIDTALVLSDRPIYVKATEVTNVSSKSARRVRVNTIGG